MGPLTYVWRLSHHGQPSRDLSTCCVCPTTVNQPRFIHVWRLSCRNQPAKTYPRVASVTPQSTSQGWQYLQPQGHSKMSQPLAPRSST